jgi:4'-phosphopantetheinyl transferase
MPGAGVVDVWPVALDRVPQSAAAVLDADEIRRAEGFKRDRGRRRWVAARAALRTVLAGYIDVHPRAVAFSSSRFGKPELDPPCGLSFNLSHAGDACLIACARGRRVGVDLEVVKPRTNVVGIARLTMLEREWAAVERAPDPLLAFYAHWVAKEAMAKALGRGVADLRHFEIALGAPDGPRVVQVHGDPREGQHWTLQSLALDAPFAAALAVEGGTPATVRVQPWLRWDHVSKHPHPLQLRAAGDRGRGPRGSAPVRPQDQRLQQAL